MNDSDKNSRALSSDELWAKAAQGGHISREELGIGKGYPLNGDKLSIENYIRDLKNTIYKQQRKIRELNEVLQKEQDIRNYCHVCCNATVEPELTSDNDLSYISVGETEKGYGLYIRSGDDKMKNPCRNCDDAYINQIGWHKPSSVHVECFNCEKRREYDELLDKHRRYEKGERIKSLDELNDCGNYVYVCDRLTHIGWLVSMQFRTVQGFFDKGFIYRAIDRNCVD